MEDKQALALFQLAAKLAATIPEANPIRILKYQARRLLNLPDRASLFDESDLIMVVATVFPMMHVLKKVVSWDQIRLLINKMEEGEKNEKRDNPIDRPSENSAKPN